MSALAVFLAAFNGIHWLTELLNSILVQTGVSVTMFVSVDRSTDGTQERIKRLTAGHVRILLVLPHGERFGGGARNFFRLLRYVDFSGFAYVSVADHDV